MAGPVTLAVEGITDVAVVKRLLLEAGLEAGPEYVKTGKEGLDRRIAGYNSAARFSCWLVIRDLDRDAECVPGLVRSLLSNPAEHMRLHVAVRSIESWLLADAEAFSQFLSVAPSRIPREPEAIDRPKHAVVELARHSRKRAVREALVPDPGSSAAVGPGYASAIIDFATNHWRPSAAEPHSESLRRLCDFFRRIASREQC